MPRDSVVSRFLHHAFMVFGVLCGGGVRLLAVLRLVGEQCKLLGDIGCCQAGEAMLHSSVKGTDQRAKSSRCTSFQTVSESRRMPSQSKIAQRGNQSEGTVCSNIMSVSHRALGDGSGGPVREKTCRVQTGVRVQKHATQNVGHEETLPPHPLRTQRRVAAVQLRERTPAYGSPDA